jgi:hypothetical protein
MLLDIVADELSGSFNGLAVSEKSYLDENGQYVGETRSAKNKSKKKMQEAREDGKPFFAGCITCGRWFVGKEGLREHFRENKGHRLDLNKLKKEKTDYEAVKEAEAEGSTEYYVAVLNLRAVYHSLASLEVVYTQKRIVML